MKQYLQEVYFLFIAGVLFLFHFGFNLDLIGWVLAGNFLDLEAAFGRLNGVMRTATGYCGGTLKKPTYREVKFKKKKNC